MSPVDDAQVPLTAEAASLGPRLAVGKQAEVFAWGETQVLKLFFDPRSRGSVEYEAGTARAVHATGVRCPAVGEVIELNGRFGLIYERVDGPSMGADLLSRPWRTGRLGCRLAEMQVEVHAVRAPAELPSLHDRFGDKIRSAPLSDRLRDAALAALDALPRGDALCHADFHPFNVIITAHGPVTIDWNDSARGDPAGDIAWTWLSIASATIPLRLAPVLLVRDWLCRAYRRRRLELTPLAPDLFARWLVVAAAARSADDNCNLRWCRRLAARGLLG